MLRKQTIEQSVSEQEESAQLAEGRKATAEQEFVILANGKKKLLEECEDIKNQILIEKDNLLSSKEEVSKIKSNILEVQNLYTKEKDKLDKIIIDNNEFVKNFNDNKLKVELDIKVLKDLLEKLQKTFDKNKFDNEQAIKDLVNSKEKLQNEIKNIQDKAKEVLDEQSKELSKLEELKSNNEVIEKEKITLQNELDKLSNNILDAETTIETKKLELSIVNTSITNKKDEIIELDNKISKKQEELSNLEKQAFAILQKQDVLNSREAFIKSQYERAGIKWE